MPELLACVAEQSLVDHHCHGVLYRDADETTLESMLNEGAGPGQPRLRAGQPRLRARRQG